MAVSDTLKSDARFIEEWLEDYFSNLGREDGYPVSLLDAAAYSLFAGGKRLRPSLVLMSNRLFGSRDCDIAPLAGALELIHTYSLIHDDLPAMDNDDLRRGMPTCHIRFGEAGAILAGDALLTEAFGMCSQLPFEAKRVLRIIQRLSSYAGFAGMVAGQVADLAAETIPAGEEELKYIHRNKTGALITASLLLPAVANAAEMEEENALSDYGHALGMLFQITDDILDVSGETAKLGKPAGSDVRQGKTTYVSLYGLDGARRMAEESASAAVAALTVFGERSADLEELARYILVREH